MGGARDEGPQPTPSVCVLLKRKPPLENELVTVTSHCEELYVGSALISCGDGDGTVSKFPVKIRHVVLSGGEVDCLCQGVLLDEQFPLELTITQELWLQFRVLLCQDREKRGLRNPC